MFNVFDEMLKKKKKFAGGRYTNGAWNHSDSCWTEVIIELIYVTAKNKRTIIYSAPEEKPKARLHN